MALIPTPSLSALVCILLVSVVFSTRGIEGTREGALLTYVKGAFEGDPSKELNHFLISNVSGMEQVYVGAMSTLIVLDTELNHVRNASTDPGDCESPCENPNKILAEAPAPFGGLIYCTGADGKCGYVDMKDLSLYDDNNDDTITVTIKGSDSRFVGQVAMASDGNLYFYVGASVTVLDFYPIALRQADVDNPFTFSIRQSTAYASKSVDFVQILMRQDYVFFAVHDSLDTTPRSKLGRICLSTMASEGALSQYMEIILSCHLGLLQSAYIGPAGFDLAMSLGIDATDDLLYAVFSDGTNSTMCFYTMESIQEKFVDAAFGCSSQYAGASLAAGIPYYTNTEIYCPKSRTVSRDAAKNAWCTAAISGTTIFKYAEASDALTGYTAVDLLEGPASAITVMSLENKTVAFIASTDGTLHKVHIEAADSARVYETVNLTTTNVLSDIHLDEEKEELYILSTSELLKLDIINCAQYETCDTCIGPTTRDGDPFCGWCTLETTCTRKGQCGGADVDPAKWLSYSDECIAIQDVNPPSQYRGSPPQDFAFSVLNLPTADAQYTCQFSGLTQAYTVTVNGNVFTCQTPEISDRPGITSGDFTTMTLEVFYSGTNKVIVTQEYPFFDCALITGCLPCVTSNWGCEWCVYGYSCTHDTSTCNGANVIVTHNDTARCPQMDDIPDPILIPVGAERSITLSGRNLPIDDNRVSYQCLLDIQGSEEMTFASLTGDDITCASRMYDYDSSDGTLLLNVSVSVVYSPGHVIDDQNNNTVTLYDCGAIGSSCSSCIAPSVLNELTCGWCPGTTQCEIQENGCDGYQAQNSTCPRPILTGFSPPSGPIEGNTTVTIRGTDLGKEIGDIINITVAGLDCSLHSSNLIYMPGVSVQCITSESPTVMAGSIVVAVERMNAGIVEINPAEYTDALFDYKDPTLTGFSPGRGIRAGGTLVSLTGTDLDTGNNRQVVIGGADCLEVEGSLTTSSMECYAGRSVMSTSGGSPVVIAFDAGERRAAGNYTYAPNPSVTDYSPKQSVSSGGIDITVTGIGLSAVQSTSMIIINNGIQISQPCNDVNKTDVQIVCVTPALSLPSRRRRQDASNNNFNFTFAFDGYVDETRQITYCLDPVYNVLTEILQLTEGQGLIDITGSNFDCIDEGPESYIEVCVGTGRGTVTAVMTNTSLQVLIPPDEPEGGGCDGETLSGCSPDLPCLVVNHGRNLNFTLGNVRYHVPAVSPVPIIIGCVAGVLGFIILVFIILAVISRRNYQNQRKKIGDAMNDFIEMSKGQVMDGFFRDQEMSDIEEQLQGLGMPFVSNQDYMKSMLFFGLTQKPSSEDPSNPSETEERAMMEFSKLLGKKEFLLVFIHALDECKELTTRDRANIASLLTVVLVMEGKFRYLTDVLTSLMSETIATASEKRRLKQLFKRTENIEDKLLTNWISLAMFKFVKENVGHSLYMLYQAIKIHCEKGPVDAITGQSFYSLNFDNLLTECHEFEEMTLQVHSELGEETVNVLNIDTITQVKEKILDAMYRTKHTKFQRSAAEVDLVIRSGNSGQLVLSDKDNTTQASMGWCEINSLKHYGINSGTTVLLANKQDLPNCMTIPLHEEAETVFCENDKKTMKDDALRQSRRISGLHHDYQHVQEACEEGIKLFHLTQRYDEEEEQEEDDGCCERLNGLLFFKVNHKHRDIKEIYLQRLVSVQQSIQKFVDDALMAMFTIREDEYVNNLNNVPFALRFLFNFFEEEASRYEDHQETALTWKNNTLPMRFWATILAHPSFIFNMRQSRTADASVIVLHQMMDNACKGLVPKLKMNASPSRLLFNKDLQRYIELITLYYHNIQNTPSLAEEDLHQECSRIDDEFQGLFSRVATLRQLYDFIRPHESLIVEALVEDEKCRAARFASSLERVGSTLDDHDD